MKTFILIAINVICVHCAQAQPASSPFSLRYAGIGTYSQNFIDVFSFVNNQAALSHITEATAGVLSEVPFMLKELKRYEAVIALPLKQGTAGITAGYAGYKNYSQSQLGVAYSRTLGQKADLGVEINYHVISIQGYGNAAAITFQVGSHFHLTEKLIVGSHVYNPVGGRFGKSSHEKIPSVYTIGLGYEASDKLFTSAAITKQEDKSIDVNVGLHYAFVKQFFARTGISSLSGNWFFGVGLIWENFRTDVAATWHPQLGFTPAFMIIFKMKENKPEQE